MEKKTKVKFNVLAIFCIVIFCMAITPITFQNDTYYSIAIGKHIVETGTVDMMDPFSWHEDLPYTYPHWAYDVGTYLVYNLGESVGIGGFAALYIATMILSVILGIVIYYACCKFSKNNLISFFITLGIVYLLKNFIAARAQLVTYILFALTVLFIENFIETKKKRYAVYLIIIPIIIANVHCAVWPFYFVLYVPYIAEYLLAVIVDANIYYNVKLFFSRSKLKRLSKKEGKQDKIEALNNKIKELEASKENVKAIEEKRRANPYKVIFKKEPAVKWLILIMIISLFTGLLTPLGDVPYTYYIKTMQGNTTQNISEHQPLTLINNTAILIVFTMFLLVLIFTDTKLRLRDFFMLAGLTLMTLMSRRQASLFAIIAGFIFVKLITALFEKYDKTGTETVMKFMTKLPGKIITIFMGILISLYIFVPKIGNQFVNKASYPVDAANFIIENLDLDEIRLYNEYNYGSYLLYRGIPVFIDSRADLYAPEFNGTKGEDGKYKGRNIFSDYINTSNISTYYENTFNKYDITHTITTKKAKLNMFLSRDENYKEIYSDKYFVIYERLNVNN